MVTFMRGAGKTTKHMALEFIHIKMELDMKETGMKINNMVKVSKHGQMERLIKVLI